MAVILVQNLQRGELHIGSSLFVLIAKAIVDFLTIAFTFFGGGIEAIYRSDMTSLSIPNAMQLMALLVKTNIYMNMMVFYLSSLCFSDKILNFTYGSGFKDRFYFRRFHYVTTKSAHSHSMPDLNCM